MASSLVKTVSKNTALNPIARAVAKKKLESSMRDHRISILMLDEGEDASSEVTASSVPIYAIIFSLDELNKTDSVEYRKLKSAGNILLECAENKFKWRRDWAVTIDNALEICQEQWSKIPPKTLQKAISLLRT